MLDVGPLELAAAVGGEAVSAGEDGEDAEVDDRNGALCGEGPGRRCWWGRRDEGALALLPDCWAAFQGGALAARASPLATGCDPLGS